MNGRTAAPKSSGRQAATPPNVRIAFMQARMRRVADALDGIATALENTGNPENAKLARLEAKALRASIVD
jgi:hypothetical protein